MLWKSKAAWIWRGFMLLSILLSPDQSLAQTNTNALVVTAEVQGTNAVRSVTTVVQTLGRQGGMSFGLDRFSALRVQVFSIPLWQYLASIIFIALAFNISKLLEWVIGSQIRRWAERRTNAWGTIVIDLVHGPVKIVSFVIFLHIGLELFTWPDRLTVWISRGLLIVVAFSMTYMALKSVDVVISFWRQRAKGKEDRTFNEHLFPVISNSSKVFVVVVAILVTSQNLGLNITAMLASLSIGGLALGLAAQDTVANLFGAVAVFVDKPFRVGDRIKLDSIDGVVEAIGLRSTRVRNLEGYLVTIPNKTMGNATITNVTRRPNIKTEVNIGITYDTPAGKVKLALDILEQVYRKHPMTQDLVISFNKFADSALNINVVHWWQNTDYRAYVKGMEEFNLLIKERFDQAGIEFAFPTQTLFVKQEPGVPPPAELSAGMSQLVRRSGEADGPG